MIEARSISGSAKAVLEFAREAANAHPGMPKIDLSVLTFDRGDGENALTRAIRDIGVPHDVVFEHGAFDTKIIGQLRQVVEKRRADVIWSNSVKSHFLVRWSGVNRARKWVAFHHGYTTTDFKARLYSQLDWWSLHKADRVLTSSAAFVAEVARKNVPRERVHVQHMPIRPFAPAPAQRLLELRRQLGLDDRTRVLLSVGRLSHEKAHVDLVHAFQKIREEAGGAPVRLVLVGEGPERPRIEELCCKLNLADSVILAGQQDDVNPYYGIADVFVLPSLSEGCPNVLLEAMAAGVPVVATAVGGIPEVITNGTDGILVKKQDPRSLAAATIQILNDGSLRNRLVSSARQVIARKTPQAYFNSIVSVFNQACANGPSGTERSIETVNATGGTL